MFLDKKRRCPKCAGNIKFTTEQFKEKVFELVQDEYEVLGKYINNSTKVKMKHTICNNIYYPTPHNFLQNKSRCSYCQRSKGEEIITSLLDKLDYNFNTQVSFSDCKYKRLLKFDFQIFKEDGSFILLEYNGIQHYKQTFGYQENFNSQIKRDQIKIDYCKNKGILLYIIRYDEDIEERLKEILNDK